MSRIRVGAALLAVAAVAAVVVVLSAPASAGSGKQGDVKTATPIKHLVVVFQENVSFDHYFGTYPEAANTDGSPFAAAPGTPPVNGLSTSLLASNPNSAPPKRLDSSATGLAGDPGGQITCDQDHNYSDEQQAFDSGKMDQFVQSLGTDGGTHNPGGGTTSGGALCDPKIVMDYYDGNSVTALWNYAQHFSMSDNSFGTTFGPSAPGAINITSGNTGGVDTTHEVNSPSVATAAAPNADTTPDGSGGFSLTGDAQPYWDDCSTRNAVALKGTNIGDELNAAGLSWGWFQGGFAPTTSFSVAAAATGHPGQPTATFIPNEFSGSFTGKVIPTGASNQALCDAVHPVGVALGETATSHTYGFKDDYIAHHEPFQYYAGTANPHHLAPASLASIGTDTQHTVAGVPQFDTANHNYDSSDFDQLVAAITAGKLPPSALPAVTYLKAPGYQDGHAAYSEPLDEQQFLVREINALEKTPDWSSTAVIISYDDSDGWYDHVYSGVTNGSLSPADNLTDTVKGAIGAANPTSQQCGSKPLAATPLAGEQGRCGFGPRLPLLLISPCSAQNTVDSNLSDQSSILNFIEYNWHLPAIAGSFDQALKSADQHEHIPFDLAGLFDFGRCDTPAVALDPASGRVDLRNASLSKQTLKQGDFSGALLTSADLSSSNLFAAFFEDADLQGANLQGSNLMFADFTNANLQGANLQSSNLNGANFRHANLTGAHLQGTNLNDAVWSDTECPDGTNSSADGGTCESHI
jgi:phospholipase C